MVSKSGNVSLQKGNAVSGSLKKKKRMDAIFIYGFLAWPIIHWLIFTGYADVMMIVRSFQEKTLLQGYKFTFENYENMWKYFFAGEGPGYWNMRSVLNSLAILPEVLFIGLPSCFLAAYYIYRKYPMHGLVRIFMMFPTIISAVVWCLVWKLLCDNQLGVFNKILTQIGLEHVIPKNGWLGDENTAFKCVYLFSIWTGVGGSNMLYFSSAMTRMPQSLVEAAYLDGANDMTVLLKIILPLIWPVYCTMTIFSLGVIGGWYLPSLLMTGGGPDGATATIGMIVISEAKSNLDVGMVSCFGTCFAVIFGTLITLAKKGINSIYEEVEY